MLINVSLCIFLAHDPDIVNITSNLIVEEGTEIQLECKVNGRPPPKVTWFKDGKSINNRNKFRSNITFIHTK